MITALVGSGLTTDSFVFLGFLKKKTGKMKKELEQAKSVQKTIVFYESPHRLLKTLDVCKDVFGEQTEIALARELTKKFEEFIRGTIKDVSENMSNRDILGEFIVLIEPNQTKISDENSED